MENCLLGVQNKKARAYRWNDSLAGRRTGDLEIDSANDSITELFRYAAEGFEHNIGPIVKQAWIVFRQVLSQNDFSILWHTTAYCLEQSFPCKKASCFKRFAFCVSST